MRVTELLRISMTTRELPRAEAFYCEALGFVPREETVIGDPAWMRLMAIESPSTARTVALRLGAQEVELVDFSPPGRPYPEPSAANDPWFQHIAVVVANIEDAWARLQRLSPMGITVGGPQRLPPNTGGVTACKFRDPDGHPLELLHFPPGVGADVWHANAGAGILGYDHSAIVVRNVERSISFYTDVLGFRMGARTLNRGSEQDRLDGLANTEVDVVALEPAEVATPHLELLCYRKPPGNARTREVRANDIDCTRQVLRVDDLAALVGRLQDAAATFVSPGIVTLGDGSRMATIRDPDGHMIVLTA
jgi:catechol 2,3-dioxygenase-like lactoylglutathione lyase family enzyme